MDTSTKSVPTFALALGGGGARGIAHIHILEVLDEMAIKPVAISGTSIGAIMAAAYAAGMSGQDIRQYTLEVMANRMEVINRLWQLRPSSIGKFFSSGLKLIPLDIENVIEAFLPSQIPADFSELKIQLTVTGTDFYAPELVTMNSGNLRSAIAASAAIPGLFKPVLRGGRALVDGGISDPVPFEVLRNSADYVIAIDVVGAPSGDPSKLPSTMDALFGASQIMMQTVISQKLANFHPSIFLRPAVSRFKVLDFLKTQKILDETAAIRDELRYAIQAVLQHHQNN